MCAWLMGEAMCALAGVGQRNVLNQANKGDVVVTNGEICKSFNRLHPNINRDCPYTKRTEDVAGKTDKHNTKIRQLARPPKTLNIPILSRINNYLLSEIGLDEEVLINYKVNEVDFPTDIQTLARGWNCRVQTWFAVEIYRPLKKYLHSKQRRSLFHVFSIDATCRFMTMIIGAVWHGIDIGFYIFYAFFSLSQEATRIIWNEVDKRMYSFINEYTRGGTDMNYLTIALCYVLNALNSFIRWTVSFLLVINAMLPFMLHTWDKILYAYSSIYHTGNILTLIIWCLALVINYRHIRAKTTKVN